MAKVKLAGNIDQRFADTNNPPVAGQLPPDYKPPKEEVWSKPPIKSTNYAGAVTPDPETSIRLRQGIVTEIKMEGAAYLIQNVNDNEDDIVEFSYHGDRDGIWGYLCPGNLIQVNRGFFLLNRTHKDVLYVTANRILIK